MVSMFQEAVAFNQPLTYWKILNVNVEGMEGMFHGAILFDHRRDAPWWEGTSLVELAKTNPKLFHENFFLKQNFYYKISHNSSQSSGTRVPLEPVRLHQSGSSKCGDPHQGTETRGGTSGM